MAPPFFKLPITFSIEKLQHDLQVAERNFWISHFNSRQYSGSWTSIALRSQSGSENDINSFPNKNFIDTPLLDHCIYFKEIIDWFQCEKEAVRLLCLGAKSEIKEHKDNDTSYEDGFFRIHIPIVTNDDVLFYVNKMLLPMKMGECWYADFQLPHSVHNNSEHPRTHLVIDCKRNQWSDEVFREAGYVLKQPIGNSGMSAQMKKQVIEELLRNPTDANLLLIQSLQSNF